MIKPFKEYYKEVLDSVKDPLGKDDYIYAKKLMEDAYNAGMRETQKHYEHDKIRIHEYYTAKVNELMGTEEKLPKYTENHGKLT